MKCKSLLLEILLCFLIITNGCNNFKRDSSVYNFKKYCDSIRTYKIPFGKKDLISFSYSSDTNFSKYHSQFEIPLGKIVSKNFIAILYSEATDGFLLRLDTYDLKGKILGYVYVANPDTYDSLYFYDFYIDKNFSIYKVDSILTYDKSSNRKILKKVTKDIYKIDIFGRLKTVANKAYAQ